MCQQGRLRIIAAITEIRVIKKVLRHLKLVVAPPLIAPARQVAFVWDFSSPYHCLRADVRPLRCFSLRFVRGLRLCAPRHRCGADTPAAPPKPNSPRHRPCENPLKRPTY